MTAPPPPHHPDWAWFLDVDGTLIDIAPTPSAIHVPPGLPARLAALAVRHGGALALVSGRALDNVLQLVAPFRPPIAGLHGLERRSAAGRVLRPAPLPGLDRLRADLGAFATAHPGVVVEDKDLSLALHYRLAPAAEADCRRAAEAAVAGRADLVVARGKMVFEIRPAGSDKGGAVAAFMAEPPFAGRVPVFVGDDVTDEDGFAAANRLGGHSVLVGPERATLAQWRLPDVAAAGAWLFG
jgi:trehalose 6-phosphate phosphatase